MGGIPNILKSELVNGQATRLQTAFTALHSLREEAQKVKDTAVRKRGEDRCSENQAVERAVSQKSIARFELMLQQEQTGDREMERKEKWLPFCILHYTVQITSLSPEHLPH